MRLLRPLECFSGIFQCLFGMLVSGLVIFFSVVRSGDTMRVCGEFVKFGGSSVRIAWHCSSVRQSSQHNTTSLSELFNTEGYVCQHRQNPAFSVFQSAIGAFQDLRNRDYRNLTVAVPRGEFFGNSGLLSGIKPIWPLGQVDALG
jgi:hypothetical protein